MEQCIIHYSTNMMSHNPIYSRQAINYKVTFTGSIHLISYTVHPAEKDIFIPRFRVVHVITNPTEAWKGHSGFIVPETVQAELAAPTDWVYYVVGPPPMITAMRSVMERLAVPKEQTVIESFAGYES